MFTIMINIINIVLLIFLIKVHITRCRVKLNRLNAFKQNLPLSQKRISCFNFVMRQIFQEKSVIVFLMF